MYFLPRIGQVRVVTYPTPRAEGTQPVTMVRCLIELKDGSSTCFTQMGSVSRMIAAELLSQLHDRQPDTYRDRVKWCKCAGG